MKNGFLKNYTCEVPVTRTINRIEDVLIRCGVKANGYRALLPEKTGAD